MVDKVAHLESRQDQSLHRTRDIEVRLQEMEKELRDLRSRSPSVAPTTPRGQGTLELEIRLMIPGNSWLEAGLMPEGLAWRMKFVHGFLRSSVHLCLKTLMGLRFAAAHVGWSLVFFTEDSDRANRQVQSKLLQCLQAVAWTSRIEGQASRALWVKRNRSPEERATVLVTLKNLVSQHAVPGSFEPDGRGRFWVQGQYCFMFRRCQFAIVLCSCWMRGGGRLDGWVDGPLLAKLLKIDEKRIREHFAVPPSQ